MYSKATVSSPTTAIDELGSKLQIYPNPARKVLNFVFEGKAEVRLLNVLGLEVSQFVFEAAGVMDIAGLPAGNYLACIKTQDGVALRRVAIE